jgi:PKHD-type hydroxylase
MDLTNKFYYFRKALDRDTCEKIISLGKERMETDQQKGYSVDGRTAGNYEKLSRSEHGPRNTKTTQELLQEGVTDSYVRDSKITWFNESWLFDLLKPYIYEANTNAGWNWQLDFHENMQFTTYNSGGFYGWHTDGGSDSFCTYQRYIHGVTPKPLSKDGTPPHYFVQDQRMVGKIRKLSMTVNLTDETTYEGGDLMLDFGPHSAKGQYKISEAREQGTIIIFPSFLYHCVSPVTSGTRYSLVMWSLGDPFK